VLILLLHQFYNSNDHHDVTEILVKVALNTINLTSILYVRLMQSSL